MARYRYSDATLKGMTKDELINYVRMCEHNCDVMEQNLEQQTKNFEIMFKDWEPVKHGKWIKNSYGDIVCSECQHTIDGPFDDHFPNYCSECGTKMDKE